MLIHEFLQCLFCSYSKLSFSTDATSVDHQAIPATAESVDLNEAPEHIELIEIIEIAEHDEHISTDEAMKSTIDPMQNVDNVHTPTAYEQYDGTSLTDDQVKPLKMLAQICVNELNDITRRNSVLVDRETVIDSSVCGSRRSNTIEADAYEENNNNVNVIGNDLNELKHISERCDRKRSRKSDHPRKKIQSRHFEEQHIINDFSNFTESAEIHYEEGLNKGESENIANKHLRRNFIELFFYRSRGRNK